MLASDAREVATSFGEISTSRSCRRERAMLRQFSCFAFDQEEHFWQNSRHGLRRKLPKGKRWHLGYSEPVTPKVSARRSLLAVWLCSEQLFGSVPVPRSGLSLVEVSRAEPAQTSEATVRGLGVDAVVVSSR